MACEISEQFWNHAATSRRPARRTASKHRKFDESFFAEGSADVDRFIEWFHLSHGPDVDVLEIGCGPGRMTRRLSERYRHVVGADISQPMLDLAAFHLSDTTNVAFVKTIGDGTLPVGSDTMDCVLSYIVMQHIPSKVIQLRYLSESVRLLKPGGIAAIQLRSAGTAVRIRDFWASVIHTTTGMFTFHASWTGARVSARDLELAAAMISSAKVAYVQGRYGHTWFVASKAAQDPNLI